MLVRICGELPAPPGGRAGPGHLPGSDGGRRPAATRPSVVRRRRAPIHRRRLGAGLRRQHIGLLRRARRPGAAGARGTGRERCPGRKPLGAARPGRPARGEPLGGRAAHRRPLGLSQRHGAHAVPTSGPKGRTLPVHRRVVRHRLHHVGRRCDVLLRACCAVPRRAPGRGCSHYGQCAPLVRAARGWAQRKRDLRAGALAAGAAGPAVRLVSAQAHQPGF